MPDSGFRSPPQLIVSDAAASARTQLPPEILSAIFLHLDPHTLFTSVRALSRQWRNEVETALLPNQFASGRWKVGLRIANSAAGGITLPAPIHASGTNEHAVMEANIEAANAAVMDNPDLAVARLRDMLNTPGTLESQLPVPGPRPISIVTIPLTFVGYDRTTASLKFASDAWHAITNSTRNRSGLLNCTFHIVWNEAGRNVLETAKPDPQNYWLSKFFVSEDDSTALPPNTIPQGGCDSPLPMKLVATPLAPRVLTPRNTNAVADPSSLNSGGLQSPGTNLSRSTASRLMPPNPTAPDAQEAATGPLDWSDASHHYLHLRTLALGIEFFTRQSARANLLTRKLEAERERRLRGESSDEDDDDEEESDSDEEVEVLQKSQNHKGHDSMSSSISSLSLSRHASVLKLKDLEKAAAGVASSNPQAFKLTSTASGPGSGITTAYRTAVQSASQSGASTPLRMNGNGTSALKPPTYADFARAAAKGSANGQGRNTSSPIRPTAMRPQGVPASARGGSAQGGAQSPVAGPSSQPKKEIDVGKGKGKLRTPFSTPFSGTPFPPASPVPSRPGTPGPSSGKGKGQQDKKESSSTSLLSSSSSRAGSASINPSNAVQRAENGSTSTLAVTPALRNNAAMTQTSSSTPLSSGATTSGPPSLAPPGTPDRQGVRMGPRGPRAHFHAVVLPAEHFSPSGSATNSPHLGPSAGPSSASLSSPGGAAGRPAPNGIGSGSSSSGGGDGSGNGSARSGSGIGMPPPSFLAAKRAANRENWDDRLMLQAEAEFRQTQREREESAERGRAAAESSAAPEGRDGETEAPLETGRGPRNGTSSVRANGTGSSALRDGEPDDDPEVNHGSVWRSGDVYARGQWRIADRVPGEDSATQVTNNSGVEEANDEEDDDAEEAAAGGDVPGGIAWTWTR
ncbi:unnamed protein product [Tilletia controversa]|uniref:F-box domain-containing protein n=1 Tax=Tilletia controversa TaxID=13291 RepID=A0A8X7MZW1_9BASI|nr:hypothetical protein CF328_g545 [Tilletia controversa]KAE8255167.1 hypothetical protein A4X06_0g558 [Tilletia controversa]CAD6920773.1 unnamed protein product [Tilletia controversa]CAD6930866.1 unnamed protein product [Tilletia controversa]CAD6952072.1 unnamed protein product [Tilletia controversa]